MRLRHVLPLLALLLVASAPVAAADSPIRLPTPTVVPAKMPPAPAPAVGGMVTLDAEQLYVIDSKVDCVVRAHPAGLVSIEKKKGPRDVTAKFAGGTGAIEDRTFDGPFVFVLKATGTGRVELDVIPLGLKGEADIVTATVDVTNGQGPKPPPNVDPKKDDTVVPVAAKGLRVLFIYESSANLTGEQMKVLYSQKVVEYLNAKCAKSASGHPEWRRLDQNVPFATTESATIKALWDSTKPKLGALPQILIVNDQAGQLYPLPATEAETLKLLEQYGGK